MYRLHNILQFAGLSKDEYDEIFPELMESNRRGVKVLSLLIFAVFGIFSLLDLFLGVLPNGIEYVHAITVFSFATFLLNQIFGKKYPRSSFLWALMIDLIIYIGTISLSFANPTDREVPLMVAIVVVPLFFSWIALSFSGQRQY